MGAAAIRWTPELETELLEWISNAANDVPVKIELHER
jgi:hypothetical protein